jgi:hypothetical protein
MLPSVSRNVFRRPELVAHRSGYRHDIGRSKVDKRAKLPPTRRLRRFRVTIPSKDGGPTHLLDWSQQE